MKIGVRIVVALMAVAMYSCIAPQNAQMVGVDVNSWSKAECIIYENSDTISLRNINLALRYNDDFRVAALPLKIAITTPDSLYFEEIVEFKLQHPTTAMAISTTESLPYRNRVTLNKIGAYTFSFEPLSVVRGVEAIGIELK